MLKFRLDRRKQTLELYLELEGLVSSNFFQTEYKKCLNYSQGSTDSKKNQKKGIGELQRERYEGWNIADALITKM